MTLSVSALNNQIKSILETTFLSICVEGEVSRITYHNSGHLYFTLKDENSSISCVMFRGNNAKMKFRLEEGMAVVVHGGISLYVPRGSYQINVTKIEPAGEGALALAYEQLKKKLQQKGYFNNKKPIPKIINHIAVVTSATGAALQDMLRVANNRWPLVKITVIDTIVQGENSASMIAKNIQKADSLNADVIVIGRGGGSLEDLWGFNEEIVADAIYRARTPLVSAVGHEIDFVISDFVADLRAPTPSASMEMILPDKTEMLMRIDEMQERLEKYLQRLIYTKEESLNNLKNMFKTHSYEAKIEINQKEIELVKRRFNQIIESKLQNYESMIEMIKGDLSFNMKKFLHVKENYILQIISNFQAQDPSKGLKDGYAQIVKDGSITPLESLHVEDVFELQNPKKIITAKVVK
ncbi:exodeoxyribonuclease VII large subunit [Sulfurospirillum sp. 1307]|jgi:exodeoxyribonuclease VII large subunit